VDVYRESAKWSVDAGVEKRLRRRANRKLKQRRGLRLRPPNLRDLGTRLAAFARKSATVLAILLAVSALGAGAWGTWHWVTHSPRFAVRHLEVVGHARVTEDEIVRLAGLSAGANVFSVSTNQLERAIEQSPWIASARVSRRLPDGLRVEVREHAPAAMVVLDAPYLVDASGHPFKRAALERGDADGLIVITGLPRTLFASDPGLGSAALREAMAIAARWHKQAERPPVGEVHIGRTGVTLYTLDGAVAVEIGRARGTELEARLSRFDVIWAALSEEERAATRTIHLDSATRPDRVTVELADAR
jgi:cell division protein FtsQ